MKAKLNVSEVAVPSPQDRPRLAKECKIESVPTVHVVAEQISDRVAQSPPPSDLRAIMAQEASQQTTNKAAHG